jgi:hypothetical protein
MIFGDEGEMGNKCELGLYVAPGSWFVFRFRVKKKMMMLDESSSSSSGVSYRPLILCSWILQLRSIRHHFVSRESSQNSLLAYRLRSRGEISTVMGEDGCGWWIYIRMTLFVCNSQCDGCVTDQWMDGWIRDLHGVPLASLARDSFRG